ncbi:hypothetical protein CFB41_26315 [Burkholderia sp. AU33803]|nr:hypothetical protein CFB41_26315 [Burkholderia sp. AU33803]PRD94105.1 hypothetical protein C6P88_10605 [Burkholderia contaminans]
MPGSGAWARPPDFSARCPGRTGATTAIRLAMIAAVLSLSMWLLPSLSLFPPGRATGCASRSGPDESRPCPARALMRSGAGWPSPRKQVRP